MENEDMWTYGKLPRDEGYFWFQKMRYAKPIMIKQYWDKSRNRWMVEISGKAIVHVDRSEMATEAVYYKPVPMPTRYPEEAEKN